MVKLLEAHGAIGETTDICAMITAFINDTDSVCSKYRYQDDVREKLLQDLKDRFYDELQAKFGLNEHMEAIFDAGAMYNWWSDRILWGMQREVYRSDKKTIAFWHFERDKARQQLEAFLSKFRGSSEIDTNLPNQPKIVQEAAKKPKPAESQGKGITFSLVDKSVAHDSLETFRDMWVALMLQHTEGGQGFDTLRNQYLAQGRIKVLVPGTVVTLTGRNSGMAVEVTIKDIPGKWCVPVQALKDANIPVPPLDNAYLNELH